MLSKEDLNRYNNTSSISIQGMGRTDGEMARSAGGTARSLVSMLWKLFKTFFLIMAITGTLVALSFASVIWSFHNERISGSLKSFTLAESSMVYVADTLHIDSVDTANWTEYMRYSGGEIRISVTYSQIPEIMRNAIISIEDKRFWEHKGVDPIGTGRAVVGLATGTNSTGGSTITQQLIKNLTGNNDVSILRKVREIFMALNLEKDYSKEEILEAYLNLVNFGNGYNGVQAAARGYFGKNIWDCTIAECAAIAATTQNPAHLDVFYYPEANQERRELCIWEMYDQGRITEKEYEEAMEQSAHLKTRADEDYVPTLPYDKDEDEEDEKVASGKAVWNWYDEEMFKDAINILTKYQNLSRKQARYLIYSGGLKIYSAEYVPMQEGFEQLLQNNWRDYYASNDTKLWTGACLMEYDGRILCVNGNKGVGDGTLIQKEGQTELSIVSAAPAQPGSSIKPLGVYVQGIENGIITYGSVLKDEPLPNYGGAGKKGPRNFDGTYAKTASVDLAIAKSLNATAAQLLKQLTPLVSYQFMTEKVHFTHLAEEDAYSMAGFSVGGLTYGVTCREMCGGYQIFGNGGVYNEPYTIYRIEDHEGNVLYDYQISRVPEQAVRPETATIMNKLLHQPLSHAQGTARMVARGDLDQFGKTGTTDDVNDIWYVGGTKAFVAAIWYGHQTKSEIYDSNGAKKMYNGIINWLDKNYSEFLHSGEYVLSGNVVQMKYCRDSGLKAGSKCAHTATGWFDKNNLPKTCNGGSDHVAKGSATISPSPSASALPSASPSPSPSPTESPTPTVEPTQEPTVTAPPTATPTATAPPTKAPTQAPTPTPTQAPTPTPTQAPTPTPTQAPTPTPTQAPTSTPTPTQTPPPSDDPDSSATNSGNPSSILQQEYRRDG